MKKLTVLLWISLSIGCGILGWQSSAQNEVQQLRFNPVEDVATPVNPELVSETESQRSSLYTEPSSRGLNRSLLETIPSDGGGSIVTVPEYRPGYTEPLQPADSYFQKLVAEADVVITGQVSEKTSHLIKDKAWIYTDYTLIPDTVIKGDAALIGTPITVTRSGGTVLVDKRQIYALDESNLPLKVGDAKYLLFLKFIPEQGVYFALEKWGAYQLDEDVKLLSKEKLPISSENTQERALPATLELLRLLQDMADRNL